MAKQPAPPAKTYPPQTPASHDVITRKPGAQNVKRGAEDAMRASFGLKPRGK